MHITILRSTNEDGENCKLVKKFLTISMSLCTMTLWIQLIFRVYSASYLTSLSELILFIKSLYLWPLRYCCNSPAYMQMAAVSFPPEAMQKWMIKQWCQDFYISFCFLPPGVLTTALTGKYNTHQLSLFPTKFAN